jgi:hypothetical protein
MEGTQMKEMLKTMISVTTLKMFASVVAVLLCAAAFRQASAAPLRDPSSEPAICSVLCSSVFDQCVERCGQGAFCSEDRPGPGGTFTGHCVAPLP